MSAIRAYALCALAAWAAGFAVLGALALLQAASGAGGGASALVESLILSGAHALMIAALARASWRRGAGLWLWLLAIVFVVQTALSQVEFVAFGAFFAGMSATSLAIGAAVMLAFAAAQTGAAAAAVARLEGTGRPARPPIRWSRHALDWAWRLPAAAALYVLAYFVAGGVFAWSVPEVRDFYGDAEAIDAALVFRLQIARGLVWALLAAVVTRGLAVGYWARALLTGAAFATFFAAQLFYAADVFPPAVRDAHFVEVSVSNLIYGILAAMLMAPLARAAPPASPPPPRRES